MTTANRLRLGGYVRLAIISTILWLTVLPANSDELSEDEIQKIMLVMDDLPMFSTLTVCISGKCSAAFQCGLHPSFIRRPDGSIRVFWDCDNPPEFVCASGERLVATGDWCQIDYTNGGKFRLTLLHDGFKFEEDL